MVESKLEKEVRFLKNYAVVATLFCAVILLTGFAAQNKNQKFAEIDVERINIIEKDGKLRMVISNQERQHPGIINGKVIERKPLERPPGMIFFNHLGDEMGGYVFGGNGANGHFGMMTWDKVRNAETMVLSYNESSNGTFESGLRMLQQPNIPNDVMLAKQQEARKIPDEAKRKAAIQTLLDNNELTTNRLFLGKYRDNTTLLEMSDIKGKPRVRMQVAPDGSPKLEFLDESGKVFYSLPEKNKTE